MSERRAALHLPLMAALLIASAWQAPVWADQPPAEKTPAKPAAPAVLDSAAGLKPIGGRWYVREGKPTTYVFKDAGQYVDLFGYHLADSNNDGIPNLIIRHDDKALIVDSQGYPNHPTAIFPNSRNPNRIRVQSFHFRLPLAPKRAPSITRAPMGPIGMALNGVVFFNPFEAGGMNAIEGYSEAWLDSCCGHPQEHGVYHYHKYPSCVKSPFADDGQRHSPVLGFAFDGFPVYGPYEEPGVMARDLKGGRALDVCNGHTDPARGYHYHVTPGRFPYIIGGYAGVPEPSNNPMLRRGAVGAIIDNADRSAVQEFGIRSVIPGIASRGKTHTLHFILDPATRGGVPPGVPSWVQVGPFEASKVTRQGNTVTAEVAIAVDSPVGVWLDAHIEFGTAGGRGSGVVRVLKKNDAFRVVP
ncbi:MAG: YHYH protein [Isosphaeraceae bacterium]